MIIPTSVLDAFAEIRKRYLRRSWNDAAMADMRREMVDVLDGVMPAGIPWEVRFAFPGLPIDKPTAADFVDEDGAININLIPCYEPEPRSTRMRFVGFDYDTEEVTG